MVQTINRFYDKDTHITWDSILENDGIMVCYDSLSEFTGYNTKLKSKIENELKISGDIITYSVKVKNKYGQIFTQPMNFIPIHVAYSLIDRNIIMNKMIRHSLNALEDHYRTLKISGDGNFKSSTKSTLKSLIDISHSDSDDIEYIKDLGKQLADDPYISKILKSEDIYTETTDESLANNNKFLEHVKETDFKHYIHCVEYLDEIEDVVKVAYQNIDINE